MPKSAAQATLASGLITPKSIGLNMPKGDRAGRGGDLVIKRLGYEAD
jgi:hypothetical protein